MIEATPRCLGALLSLGLLVGCGGGSADSREGKGIALTAESCMQCHNGSNHDDYAGPGLENPHPFTGAGTLTCTQCHGGDPTQGSPEGAHVPPPPEIGDEDFQERNARAYFNRLTLSGIDKFDPYEVNGRTWSPIDYLQFVNPGDLRVVIQGRSCGGCHADHAESVNNSLLATEAGVLSGSLFAIGVDNAIPPNQDRFQDTAADRSFRTVLDPDHVHDDTAVGKVPRVLEHPVYSARGAEGDDAIDKNPRYNAHDLAFDQDTDGRVISGSPLAHLYHEQVAFTCGDCHLGSAGANNRYGDFRSSGCTACHMRYSADGRSRSTDPNIRKDEPADPDDIDAPERAHVARHVISSVSRPQVTGGRSTGIDDQTCAGCHQGSNRTVMQFWGIRLDQNQDVRRGNQYPHQPDSFVTTRDDPRLFDPEVGNRTFNGRNANQYLAFEDYDGDGRDDTPPDVHHEAGMGCIDCHGSHDLHGGQVGHPTNNGIYSRQEQAVSIQCEDCHGTVDAYAETTPGFTYDNEAAELAVDSKGIAMQHVVRDGAGHFFLTSRLTGNRHYVVQIRDLVVDTGRSHPDSREPLYSREASYAMGRADGDPGTGHGPQQTGGQTADFSHMDNMSCASCHSSWTNNCVGCHLSGKYDRGNNFSNITGQRIVFEEDDADFVYQSPVFFQLGVDARGKISPMVPNTDVFFRYRDLEGNFSKIFTFSDRNGRGASTAVTAHPSLSHNAMMPHSIRGRPDAANEGVRYCVSCHLTDQGLADWGPQYDTFRQALIDNDYGALDFPLLADHIGRNPGNPMNSPMWVHQVAGLGSGLLLFDQNGAPVNPLDQNEDRVGAGGLPPASTFDPARVRFDLDGIVERDGRSTASNNHPLLDSSAPSPLRDGADDPSMSGPLGATILEKLADPVDGVVLDSWLDADGKLRGDAADNLPPPPGGGP